MKRAPLLIFLASIAVAALLSAGSASASVVNLGAAGQFTLLALTGDIQDSGPTGPQADPYSVDGPIGVVSSSGKFQTSGSRTYNGPIYLHTGATYQSSAPGAPPPTMGPAVDTMLAQAASDAYAASTFASGLAATATYGTINNTLTISQATTGNYVFNIGTINFTGGKALTLNGTSGSTFLLNVSGSITLSPGSILLSGGLTANNVMINYTGNSDISFSGGGNSSQVFGTILAPYAHVQMTPGFVSGSIIAASIQLSSGADIVPVPEMTTLLPLIGLMLVAAVAATGLRRRKVQQPAVARID